jgi:hypothetical protein
MKLRRPGERVTEDNIKTVTRGPGKAVMLKPRAPVEPELTNILWVFPDNDEVYRVWTLRGTEVLDVVLPLLVGEFLPQSNWWESENKPAAIVTGYLVDEQQHVPRVWRECIALQYEHVLDKYESDLYLYRQALKRYKSEYAWYRKSVYEPRKAHFIEKRMDNIEIASFVDRVLRSHRVGLAHNDPEKPTSHPEIRTRAVALANLFLRKQTVIDRNRETLAAVCVSRAACEHSLGLRYWDLSEFVADGTVFNSWRRDLRKHATLSPIARQKQLVGFLNLFVGRVVFHNKKDALTAHDRAKIHAFGKWISGPRMHRVASKGPHAARKLPCLAVFLDTLVSESLSSTIPPLANLLPDVSKVEGDKFIKLWSLAATIVYMVLSVRPNGRKGPSQKEIFKVSGVKTTVPTKRTLQHYILKAFSS